MAKQDKGKMTGDPVTYQIPAPAGGVQMETFIPWTLVKRGVRRQVITPLDAPQEFLSEATREREKQAADKETALMRALGLAHHWQNLLDDGRYESMTEIAAAEGLDSGRASKIARLAHLAPDVVDACLADDSSGITLEHLIRRGSLPLDWQAQREGLHVRC
jgi:hypothetical protein